MRGFPDESRKCFDATVRAEIFFPQEIVLRVRQTLDFAEGFIQSYSYEVYRGEEKLYRASSRGRRQTDASQGVANPRLSACSTLVLTGSGAAAARRGERGRLKSPRTATP